jgi:hypothetical protein
MLTLQQTTDYSQFKKSPKNRDVASNNLVESLKQNNLLDAKPILVTKNFVVIDGQHRLDAAMRMNVPISYIVHPTVTEDDISILQTQRPWTLDDYLKFYKEDKEDYKFAYDIIKEFKVKVHLVAEFFTTQTDPYMHFRKGTWKIKKNKKELREIFLKFDEVKRTCGRVVYPKVPTYAFNRALWSLVNEENYDHSILMGKLDRSGDEILHCCRFREFKNLKIGLIRLYNKKIRHDHKKIQIGV